MIGALVMAGAALGGGETDVAIAAKAFSPPRVTVLVGERVSWTNQDSVSHTVTAEDRSFDSGRIGGGGTFSRRFEAPGVVEYKCTLHRFMQGAIEVVALELQVPEQPVPFGHRAELTGRTPQGGALVALERVGSGVVATTTADEDGRFRFLVDSSQGPGAYRARSAGLSSATAHLAVAPEVRIAARRGRRGVSVRAHVVPGQPRARVVIERHEREFFGYVPVRRARLDAHSRAHVVLRTSRRLRLRVRLTQPVGGWSRTVSGVVVIPRVGSARGGGHH